MLSVSLQPPFMKTLCGKREDKVDPMHDTKACGRSRDANLRILNFDTSEGGSDVWLTVRRNSVWIRKTKYMSLFVFFISLLIVAQHVSGNHVPIIRS